MHRQRDFLPTSHSAPAGSVYTLPDACKSGNFGIAHRGAADSDAALLPISIASSANFESPSIGSRSQQRPQPMPLQLTVLVSGTLPDVAYNAYIYSNHSRVPTRGFNARASDADKVVPFTGDGSGAFTFVRDSDSGRCVQCGARRAGRAAVTFSAGCSSCAWSEAMRLDVRVHVCL